MYIRHLVQCLPHGKLATGVRVVDADFYCKLLGKKFIGRTSEGTVGYVNVGSDAYSLPLPLETLS